MKLKDGRWHPVPNAYYTDEPYLSLSFTAMHLLGVLTWLQNRFKTKLRNGYFTRTNEQLAADAGMGLRTVKNAKHDLLAVGVIETILVPLTRKGRPTRKHVTGYKVVHINGA